jgi:hypothetical protein
VQQGAFSMANEIYAANSATPQDCNVCVGCGSMCTNLSGWVEPDLGSVEDIGLEIARMASTTLCRDL